MKWNYGEEMLHDEAIGSLDEWSDDKEMAFSVMDQVFDYLWYIDDENVISFVDRGFSDGNMDQIAENKMRLGIATLQFVTFEDIFEWILSESRGDEDYYEWMKRRLKSESKI